MQSAALERIITYNNVGVEKFHSGDYQNAWDLFKDCPVDFVDILPSVKAALEKQKILQSNTCMTFEAFALLFSSNQYIQRADLILSEDYELRRRELRNVTTNNGVKVTEESKIGRNFVQIRCISSSNSPEFSNATSTSIPDIALYDSESGGTDNLTSHQPCIHARPFSIPFSLVDTLETFVTDARVDAEMEYLEFEETRFICSIIMFNIGLMEHLKNWTMSSRSVYLYELSFTLLSARHIASLPILIALLNNIGCWYLQNGNFEASEIAMERLRCILLLYNDNESATVLQDEYPARTMIMKNVLWVLYPPGSASPAA